jgi:DNA-binding MarR family transcriptional regulator
MGYKTGNTLQTWHAKSTREQTQREATERLMLVAKERRIAHDCIVLKALPGTRVEVAGRIGVDDGKVAVRMVRLVREGLCENMPDWPTARNKPVRLTDKGKKLIADHESRLQLSED